MSTLYTPGSMISKLREQFLRFLSGLGKPMRQHLLTLAFAILALIVTGFVRVLVFGYQPPEPTAVIETAGDVTVFLILRAFASGCTALTGVEAVSN